MTKLISTSFILDEELDAVVGGDAGGELPHFVGNAAPNARANAVANGNASFLRDITLVDCGGHGGGGPSIVTVTDPITIFP